MLGEVEIKCGVFQVDSLSPLVFVVALILLSLILRKVKGAYEFSEIKEKINHLLFTDDLGLYSWREKGLNSLSQTDHIFSEDIGMDRKMCYVSNGERKNSEVSWYRVAKW